MTTDEAFFDEILVDPPIAVTATVFAENRFNRKRPIQTTPSHFGCLAAFH